MEIVKNTIPDRIQLAQKLIDDQIQKALIQGAEEVLRRSSREVPLDTGNLKDSGAISVPINSKGKAVEISYNTPYAVEVHETQKNYKRGRKMKYLHDPLREFVPRFIPFLRNKINKILQ